MRVATPAHSSDERPGSRLLLGSSATTGSIFSNSASTRSRTLAIQSYSVAIDQPVKLAVSRKLYKVNRLGQGKEQLAVEIKEFRGRNPFDGQVNIIRLSVRIDARTKQENAFDVISPGDIHDHRFILFRNHDFILSGKITAVNFPDHPAKTQVNPVDPVQEGAFLPNLPSFFTFFAKVDIIWNHNVD